ncbi:MAG: chloride channel protein [Deltaproteobacteria bacterium]|nr:chloride channel protein [Deltaproteobacteria bacterium]
MPRYSRMFTLPGRGFVGWRPLTLWAGAALIGFVALFLGKGAAFVFHFFTRMTADYPWWPFVSLPAGGILLTWFMARVGAGTEGSGIQQAVAAMQVAESPAKVGWFVNLRLAGAKFIALLMGTASGFVVGLEGPTVQIGASILYTFRHFLPQDNAILRRQLVMAGGAAGIAAAFSAPLAGLMFAFEELGRHVSPRGTARTSIAVVLSGTMAYAVSNRVNYFGQVHLTQRPTLYVLGILCLITLAGALVGGAFSWLAIRTDKWMPRKMLFFRMHHPYIFVVICGVLVGICGLAAPVFGSGVEVTRHLLHGDMAVEWYYLPLKLVALLLTNLTGIPGGIFAPSLSLGAGVGSWFLPLAGAQWQGEILAVGMVAVLSAATRAPLTAAFIMIEMTNGHAMVLEMLAASMLAAQSARYFHVRFYHDLAQRALHMMPDLPESDHRPFWGGLFGKRP